MIVGWLKWICTYHSITFCYLFSDRFFFFCSSILFSSFSHDLWFVICMFIFWFSHVFFLLFHFSFLLIFYLDAHAHTFTSASQALQEEVSSRETEVDHLEFLSQSLIPLSCAADRDWLGDRVGVVRSGHSELAEWCARRACLLEQALANAQLFGEDEVEVLNWLAEVAQRLAQVSVQGYQAQLLAEQHKHTLVRAFSPTHTLKTELIQSSKSQMD